MGLFFTNATAKVVRREVDPTPVHPTAEDVIETVLWTGKVWQYPLSATAIQKLNLAISHRCHGVPNAIQLKADDLVTIDGVTFTIVLPTPTPEGLPLGSTGWDLLLVVNR